MYALFFFLATLLDILGLSLIYWEYDGGFCLYLASNWGLMGLLKPYVIYRTLRDDSDFWQGYQEVKAPDDPSRPLLEDQDPLARGTARHIATSVSALGTKVNVINFACLRINNHNIRPGDVLGHGGTAKVFKGTYMHSPVAVKMWYPQQLDKDVFDRFCKETTLLSSLRHPNIIHIEGICVIPPCVCMVMELCRGSLRDFLCTPNVTWTWKLILTIAIDCARAVACLHANHIFHKDIKSLNFLVGESRFSTWTPHDVQIWLASEQMPEFKPAFLAACVCGSSDDPARPGLMQFRICSDDAFTSLQCEALQRIVGPQLAATAKYRQLLRKIQEYQNMIRDKAIVVKISDLETSGHKNRDLLDFLHKEAWEFSVRPDDEPFTPGWSAPEVTRRQEYTAASDVYSLAVVFWELLTSGTPFDHIQFNTEVEERIRAGERPAFPEDLGEDAWEFEELITSMWAPAPEARLGIGEVLDRLITFRRRLAASATLEKNSYLGQNKMDFIPNRFRPCLGGTPVRGRISGLPFRRSFSSAGAAAAAASARSPSGSPSLPRRAARLAKQLSLDMEDHV